MIDKMDNILNKCRICLKNRTTLYSIYDTNVNISYADMIRSIANVKVEKVENIPDSICRMCRRKLREAYEFKSLIERSHSELIHPNFKRINFSDIKEVKIEYDPKEVDKKDSTIKYESVTAKLEHGEASINYNDTVIKRVDIKEPMSVLEFLNSIKEETDLDDHDYEDTDYGPINDNHDNEFVSYYKPKKKPKLKKQNVENTRSKSHNVCIKPKVYKDLKLVYGFPKKNNDMKKKSSDYIKLRMCPHCGKMTKSLKYHILFHTGKRNYKCEYCKKGFFTKSALKTHIKSHTGEKNFICEVCSAAFNNKSSLASHMLIHTDVKNHACSVCDKKFKRISSKQRHEKAHNLSNKSINCEQCNMSFFSLGNLKHHMRVHTGERPFNCELCSQPYSYKHDFNRHCFNKHGVYLKRRSVYVMNEEVLKRERHYMRELLLQVHGIATEGEPFNPYEGPLANISLQKALKELATRKIPIEFQL